MNIQDTEAFESQEDLIAELIEAPCQVKTDDQKPDMVEDQTESEIPAIHAFLKRVSKALPEGYTLDKKDVLIYADVTPIKRKPICAPVIVSGLVSTYDGIATKLRLEFLNEQKQIVSCDIALEDLERPAPAVAQMRAHHAYIPGTGREMATLLRAFRPPIIEEIAFVPGWHPTQPCIFGLQDGSAIIAQNRPSSQTAPGFQIRNIDTSALEHWKANLASIAMANPYILFSICLALTGPVLKLLNLPSLGLNLSTCDHQGKAILSNIMRSIWPGLKGEQLGACETALATTCAAACDMILVSTDRVAPPRRFGLEAALSLIMSGQAPAQASPRGTAPRQEQPARWQLAVLRLSTDPIAQPPDKNAAPLPFGMFDLQCDAVLSDIHPHASAYALHKHINAQLSSISPEAGPAFVQNLIDRFTEATDALPILFEDAKADLIHALQDTVEGDARNSAKNIASLVDPFAAICTAGELAARYDILPQAAQDIRAAIITVAKEALAQMPHTNDQVSLTTTGVENLRAWLGQNAGARLAPLDDHGAAETHKTVAGWRTDDTYFLLKQTLHKAVGHQDRMSRFLDHLAQRGILRRSGQRNSYQRRMGAAIPGRPYVYAIDKHALENVEEEDPD